MIDNSKLAALLAIPSGMLITFLFLWLFAIDITTLDHLAEFPENWDSMDLVGNAFALMMFGGATRAVYRALTGKHDADADQDLRL